MKIILPFLFLLIFGNSLFSDSVKLKDGKTLENVKITVKIDKILVEEENGTKSTFSKKQISSVRLKPVVWTIKDSRNEQKSIAEEKLRIADMLQGTNEWTVAEETKASLLILKIRHDSAFTDNETNSLDLLLTTTFVKSKLFHTVDYASFFTNANPRFASSDNVTVDKILSQNPTIKVDKILISHITKLENKYFINANLIDTKTKEIEFSEMIEVNARKDLTVQTVFLAKQMSGQIFNTWESDVIAKGEKTAKISELNKEDSKTPFTLHPVIKSALIPGWGQMANNQNGKGYTFLFSHLVLASALVSSNSKYQSALHNYSASKNLGSLGIITETDMLGFISHAQGTSARRDIRSSGSQVNAISAVLAILYLGNLADAYFSNKPDTTSFTPTQGFQFSFYRSTPVPTTQLPLESHYTVSYFLNYEW